MKKIFLLTVVIFSLSLQQANACTVSPSAIPVANPNESVFYSGDQVQFSGTSSIAMCGSINQYRWQVDGVTKSWSSTYTHTFTLPVGVTEQTYSVQLRVRNTYGYYGYQTLTITVRDNQRLYYLTDHLGSVRVTVDEDGKAQTWDDYYPFGLQMAQRTQNAGDNNDQTKFTGYQKEDQGDLDLYHAGARLYDPVIARFMSIDAFDEKYPSMTPYQYAANNPVNFIDVNGDSIDVSAIQFFDKQFGTNILGSIISDLGAMTGLQFSVANNGQLVYAKDKNGDSIVSKDKNGNEVGSSEARNRLKSAISVTEQVDASVSYGRGSKSNGSQIGIDPLQVDSFINGTSSMLDSKTMGYGMAFMHEVLHSNVGMVQPDGTELEKDTFGHTGPVVDSMNRIRSELGPNFGQRMSYKPGDMNGSYFLPFNQASLDRMKNSGIPPYRNSMFINF